MTDINGPLVDGLISAILRAEANLREIGSAILLSYPEHEKTSRRIIFEADCARTVAVEAMIEQQKSATKT